MGLVGEQQPAASRDKSGERWAGERSRIFGVGERGADRLAVAEQDCFLAPAGEKVNYARFDQRAEAADVAETGRGQQQADPALGTAQPAQTASYRAELSWQGVPGNGATLASAMRGWEHVRYEVTEEPSPGYEGERYSYTPSLGIFHAVMGLHGDILVPEDRIRMAMLDAEGATGLAQALDQLLGKPWDDELEPFRYAGDGAPVRWLHQVI